MKTCKIMWTPTTEQPKMCHALATTSAINLKLCHRLNFLGVYLATINSSSVNYPSAACKMVETPYL